jgi:hypothetical protein
MSGVFASDTFDPGAFDVGASGSGGMLPAWLRAALLAGKRKPKPVAVDPEEEDEAPAIVARASLRLRASSTDAGRVRLLLEARAARDDADFRAIVGELVDGGMIDA